MRKNIPEHYTDDEINQLWDAVIIEPAVYTVCNEERVMTTDELEVLLTLAGPPYEAVCVITSAMTNEQWRRLNAHGIDSRWALNSRLRSPRASTRAETMRVLARIFSTKGDDDNDDQGYVHGERALQDHR